MWLCFTHIWRQRTGFSVPSVTPQNRYAKLNVLCNIKGGWGGILTVITRGRHNHTSISSLFPPISLVSRVTFSFFCSFAPPTALPKRCSTNTRRSRDIFSGRSDQLHPIKIPLILSGNEASPLCVFTVHRCTEDP